MSDITPVDIEQLHAAIVTAMQTRWPDLHVDCYDRHKGTIPTPAFQFALEDVEPMGTQGTRQLECTLMFKGGVILSGRDPAAKLSARVRALNIAHWLQFETFGGQPISYPRIISVESDDFGDFGGATSGEYEAFVVRWAVQCLIGQSNWDGSGVPPSSAWLGWAPDIGEDHVDDYEQIYEEQP